MTRFLFSLRHGWRHRHAIKRLAHEGRIANVVQLDVSYLVSRGIKVLALDFDGVLAAHGQSQPDADVVAWLKKLVDSPLKLALLSNKPNQERQTYFKAEFPELLFITGFPKKPYPHGLLAIAKQFEVQPQHVLLADDRLLTGVLASCLGGAQAAYVRPARQNFKTRWIEEVFFEAVRRLERLVILGWVI